MRYLALRDLMGRGRSDPELQEAQRKIPQQGWAAQILARRDPAGWWESPESLYRPKYLSTNWQLLILADIGLTREHPAIAESAQLWIQRFASKSGPLGAYAGGLPHHCVAGNQARALVEFGYADHPLVRRTMEWLAESASPLGGWSCFGSGRNLDSWEGLSAFAVYPRARWTAAMREAVQRGAEFFLERELLQQGPRYAPWYRLHYPVHYYYDVLVGLDVLTALGYCEDRRLQPAVDHLRQRRRSDGRWNLDAVHPDVSGAVARWNRAHPARAPVPVALESPGRASKMITLRAERVLGRIDGTL